jgi:hypothetical protein
MIAGVQPLPAYHFSLTIELSYAYGEAMSRSLLKVSAGSRDILRDVLQ